VRAVVAPAVLPLVVAVYPVLHLYAANPGQSHFPWAMTAALAAGAVTLAIALGWALGDRDKAALLVALTLALALSYGHVFDGVRAALGGFGLAGVLRHRMLGAAFGLLFLAGCVVLVRTRRPLARAREGCTVVALAALVLVAGQVALSQVRVARLLASPAASPGRDVAAAGVMAGAPNIYYLVLDGRASSRVLEQYFEYSDAQFIDALRGRGFYIAERSHANYAHTFLSLASALNMEYLDWVRETLGADSTDPSLPYRIIDHSEVARFLKARGYLFVNISSGWGPTNALSYADRNTNVGNPLAEFYDVFLHSTILRPVVSAGAREYARGRILRSLGGLRVVDARVQPMFVFAHVMAPHPPFVFGRNGELRRPRSLGLRASWGDRQAYVDQLTFTDRSVLEFVDRILADSDTSPIIVIQSDHGPASSGSLDRPTLRILRERMAIFNAYLVPDALRPALHDTISPVNTFRIILGQSFGAHLPLLKDEAYFSGSAAPYQWRAVTPELMDGAADAQGELGERAGRGAPRPTPESRQSLARPW
jgi:hypothetical protein